MPGFGCSGHDRRLAGAFGVSRDHFARANRGSAKGRASSPAYGGFGVSLALIAAVGIIASFWVWIAAVMGVYWEHKAGPAAVAAMEELSAEISASEQSSVSGKPVS